MHLDGRQVRCFARARTSKGRFRRSKFMEAYAPYSPVPSLRQLDCASFGGVLVHILIVLGVFVLLIGLLVLMSLWQRKIAEFQREQTILDLHDAQERGTDQPIAQHPQIDVQACIGCGTCIAACPESGVLGLVDGVARVIHGSRCIGHGHCEDACPVNAITVGLGDVSQRDDIPELTPELETTVPGMYIAGELGGFALIRIATQQGTRALEQIHQQLSPRRNDPGSADRVDVLIVGAGPAGIAASLKAVECGMSYTTIDQDDIGGTVRKYPRRKLTLTGKLELPLYGPVAQEEFLKEELIDFWEEIIARYRLQIHSGVKLLSVTGGCDHFEAQTSHGVIRSRRVLLALGRRGTPRRLGVPGEDSEKVLYQLLDAASHRGERILVVGGGDSAIEAATGLANQPGNQVTLSYRRGDFFRLKRRNEERIREYMKLGKVRVIFDSEVNSIESDAVLLTERQGEVARSTRVENDFVFVFAGGEPPYPLLRSMGVSFGGAGVGAMAPTLVPPG